MSRVDAIGQYRGLTRKAEMMGLWLVEVQKCESHSFRIASRKKNGRFLDFFYHSMEESKIYCKMKIQYVQNLMTR